VGTELLATPPRLSLLLPFYPLPLYLILVDLENPVTLEYD